MKGGFIIKYTRPDGSVQKGRVMHADQKPEFEAKGKSFVRLIDNNLRDTGEKVIKKSEDYTIIGFVD